MSSGVLGRHFVRDGCYLDDLAFWEDYIADFIRSLQCLNSALHQIQGVVGQLRVGSVLSTGLPDLHHDRSASVPAAPGSGPAAIACAWTWLRWGVKFTAPNRLETTA